MPQGIYGSTLNDELNRLANGGTYPAIEDYLDQAAAAQAWAGSESVDLGDVTDLVGVLNYINGVTDRSKMLDIAGVCNAIAGTTGLEPAAALRQVTGFSPYPAVVTYGGYIYENKGAQNADSRNFWYSQGWSDAYPGSCELFNPNCELKKWDPSIPVYTCPTGGTYNPTTGMCE